jgi:hypothetical protein
LRIVKLDEWRVGDNAPMARIEFVDEIKLDKTEHAESASNPVTEEKPIDKTKSTAKKGDK